MTNYRDVSILRLVLMGGGDILRLTNRILGHIAVVFIRAVEVASYFQRVLSANHSKGTRCPDHNLKQAGASDSLLPPPK
jgi:hypothetical protein